jgi:hypothetical protein
MFVVCERRVASKVRFDLGLQTDFPSAHHSGLKWHMITEPFDGLNELGSAAIAERFSATDRIFELLISPPFMKR